MSFMEWNVMNSAWSNKVCEINWGLAEDKIKFPKKLWDLVNSGRTRAVKWGQDGASLVVDYDQLTDYLRSPNSIFMTKKVSSFTRQLNIYGFKKVSQANRQLRDFTRENHSRIHLFYHKYFIKDREDLLQFMTRKSHHQCCYQINKKRIHDPDNDASIMSALFDASSIQVPPHSYQLSCNESCLTLKNDFGNKYSITESPDIIEMKMEYIHDVGWVHIESRITTPRKILKFTQPVFLSDKDHYDSI